MDRAKRTTEHFEFIKTRPEHVKKLLKGDFVIGQFIKQKREQAEMTQSELYQFLPVQREKSTQKHGGRATISNIETGKRGLYFDQLEAIAAAFNQKTSEFLTEYENQ